MADLDDLLNELSGGMGETFGNSTFGGTFGGNTFGNATLDQVDEITQSFGTMTVDAEVQEDPELNQLLEGLADDVQTAQDGNFNGENTYSFGETTAATEHELEALMNVLADGGGDPSGAGLYTNGGGDYLSQQKSNDPPASMEDDELTALMYDLGGGAPPPAKASRAQPLGGYSKPSTELPADTEDELDLLMNDLGGGASRGNTGSVRPPATSNAGRSQPAYGGRPTAASNAGRAQPATNPAGAGRGRPSVPPAMQHQDELDSLMFDLGGGSGSVDIASELDSFMNQLAPGPAGKNGNNKNTTNGKTAARPSAPAENPANKSDDLMALMQDLESFGSNRTTDEAASNRRAQQQPIQGKRNQGSPAGQNPRASSRIPEEDDLDNIMRGLDTPVRGATPNSAGSRTSIPPSYNTAARGSPSAARGSPSAARGSPSAARGSPAPGRGNGRGRGGVQGRGGGRADDLDRIMAGLNDEMDTFGDVGRGGGPGRGRAAPAGRGRVSQQPLPPGVCAGCRKHITGEQVQAMGKSYHPSHFNCSTCNRLIGTGNFFEKEGQPQCEACFQSHFCRKCAHCNQAITNQVITALNQSWHPNCFVCTNCLQPFMGGNFFEKESRPYCKDCFHDVFAARCRGCGEAIQGGSVTALGASWHPHHFACATCKSPFDQGTGFFERDGFPYCSEHY